MILDIKKSQPYYSFKKLNFPLFRFSKFLKDFFSALFLISSFLIVLPFFEIISFKAAFKIILFPLSFYLIFWDLFLFTEYKLKRPPLILKVSEILENPEAYNLAEILDIGLIPLFIDSFKFCLKKKIKITSTALLYFLVKKSQDSAFIFFRLGIDPKKFTEEAKNYLEKTIRIEEDFEKNFSEDFEKVIKRALEIAASRNKERITEKELLVALAEINVFFKKVLIEFDLKKEDIANLIFWVEKAQESYEKSKKFWTKENLALFGSLGKDWIFGYTVTLDKFSIDWRDIVSRWRCKEIIGHKKEIEEVEMALAKSQLSNVLIIGEAGVGKKSIVEALAQKCYLGASLPELNYRRVVELDLAKLSASILDFEKMEQTLDQIFAETLVAGNVILVIDDLHNFIGQDVQKPGVIDITGILTKYLAIPSFKFIGITTYKGLHQYLERVPSFVDFFRKVEVSEVSEEEVIQILQNLALEYESSSKILILYPALREIVNLTARYLPSLPFPKKAIDILDEAVVYVQTRKEKVLMPHHIAEIISRKTEIPVGKMEAKEKEVLLNLENLIHRRIVNQEEAVRVISIAMRRARAGIGSKKRPMGSFLFLGPTGVGKTETSKALAEIYFGSEEKMIRLDMSEFQAISDIPRLIGAVSPVEVQGLLTTAVRENPFSLVLLDEIEKAHPDILNLLLQILDEGYITDGQSRKVIFTNTIFICTSNAGAEIIFEETLAGRKIDKDKLLATLFKRGVFRPELINRFDAVIIFNPLTKENLLEVAELMLNSLKKSLKEKEIDFEITQELKERIVELSYKPEFGAREMRRVIQDKIENSIAQALLVDKIKKEDKIIINPESFEVIILPPLDKKD